MEIITDAAQLLTVPGISAFVYLVVRAFIKPALVGRYGEEGQEPPPEPKQLARRRLITNISAFLVGIVGAVLIALVYESGLPWPELVAGGMVRGFFGAAVAVFGNEMYENGKEAFG